MSKHLINPWLAPERLSLVFLPIAGLAAAFALLPLGASNYDMMKFFVPWMNTVQDRGLASLSGDFAGYTPPYIYLMYVASGLVPWVGTVAAIKLINLPFIAILSLAIYHIVLIASESRRRAATAAALFWIVPTPLVNAFAWGQLDCVYAAFLALFVLFAIKRAPIAAASMFGVSLAFKPQPIFLLPVLLYLILAKHMRVWHLVFVPVMYLLMMVPAAIAGGHWLEFVPVFSEKMRKAVGDKAADGFRAAMHTTTEALKMTQHARNERGQRQLMADDEPRTHSDEDDLRSRPQQSRRVLQQHAALAERVGPGNVRAVELRPLGCGTGRQARLQRGRQPPRRGALAGLS